MKLHKAIEHQWRFQEPSLIGGTISTESTGEISAELDGYSPPKYGPEDGPVAPQLGVPPGRWMDLDGKHHGKSDENLDDLEVPLYIRKPLFGCEGTSTFQCFIIISLPPLPYRHS